MQWPIVAAVFTDVIFIFLVLAEMKTEKKRSEGIRALCLGA
jgi:hypothetical protein